MLSYAATSKILQTINIQLTSINISPPCPHALGIACRNRRAMEPSHPPWQNICPWRTFESNRFQWISRKLMKTEGKLIGGIPTPLKNDGVRQLGWIFNIPNGKSFKIPWFQSPPTRIFHVFFFIWFSITSMDLRAFIFIQWESKQLATTCTPTEMTSVPSPFWADDDTDNSRYWNCRCRHNVPEFANIEKKHLKFASGSPWQSWNISWNRWKFPSVAELGIAGHSWA